MNQTPINPFYPLVIAAGIIFVLAASANTVAMVHGEQLPSAQGSTGESSLLNFLDAWGNHVLIGSLAMLAGATVGAIAMDSLRSGESNSESEVRDGKRSDSAQLKGNGK
jgi:hypothetical protein